MVACRAAVGAASPCGGEAKAALDELPQAVERKRPPRCLDKLLIQRYFFRRDADRVRFSMYGTVTPEGEVTSAGRVASCMGCYVSARHERVFGMAPPAGPDGLRGGAALGSWHLTASVILALAFASRGHALTPVSGDVDNVGERLHRYRLDEVNVKSCCLGETAVRLLPIPRERDEHSRPQPGLTQAPRDLVAVHSREPDVEEHDIGPVVHRGLQRVGAVVGDPHLLPHRAQGVGEHARRVRVVVDDEDAELPRHRGGPPRLLRGGGRRVVRRDG
ncbi:uncharacterized protein SOCE26_103780 [Sorangium cellulosum]|uniref:Uncharacterized protein n=1 Tax=Sorangium cellulosum TaxID=56 RepID=A0A2L0FB59_SORCE|nr:uncharacterized protein SOCE26_103780 [Sorangium cellulosum]